MLFLVACSPDELPLLQEGALGSPWLRQSSDSGGCSEYVFDSALANLEYTTSTMARARRIIPYAPADTNLFGWTQLRYIILLESPVEINRPVDIIYFHGGGGDVGHAANGDNLVFEFLEQGYDVWCVEYRRGWHEGSYDPCIQRDVFNATAEDFNRLDTAGQWALEDARLAVEQIAANSTDSFVVYGTSFGAYLSMMCGPFMHQTKVDRYRIAGCMALYGSVPPESPILSRTPTFLLHGLTDSLNVPDRGPLFNTPPPVGRIMDGSRTVYTRIRPYMSAWLLTHSGGHGTGPITSSGLRGICESALLEGRFPEGRYRLRDDGMVVSGGPGFGGP